MKEKVFEYISKNPGASANSIASALGLNGAKALEIILELQKEGYISHYHPVPLDVDNDSSVYYKVTGKLYIEK